MTAEEWATNDSFLMGISAANAVITDRKIRLFVVECLRKYRSLVPDAATRAVLDSLERFADDALKYHEVEAAIGSLEMWNQGSSPHEPVMRAATACCGNWSGSAREYRLAIESLIDAHVRLRGYHRGHPWESSARQEVQLDFFNLLRCIVGNPFRPVAFAPSWQTETAVSLATGIYTERAFDRLPILADALEEAGCDNADVLSHCRGPGPHARGCWVVDGVVGKV